MNVDGELLRIAERVGGNRIMLLRASASVTGDEHFIRWEIRVRVHPGLYGPPGDHEEDWRRVGRGKTVVKAIRDAQRFIDTEISDAVLVRVLPTSPEGGAP